jgi:hypothetical protein
MLPDGDGYTTASIATANGPGNWSITGAGTGTLDLNTTVDGASGDSDVNITIGQLKYALTRAGTVNQSKVYLLDPSSNAYILNPAIVLLEEKDESNLYHAAVVQVGGAGTTNNGMGVSDIDFTWNGDADMTGTAYGAAGLQMESNEDLYQMMDQWGTLVTTDESTSDQYTTSVSYPDEQVTALLYLAEESASISGGSSGGGGTTVGVPILDSEVSSVGNANLIVVGGSCVNTQAASLLGSSTPLCGADFTAETGVGAGQYLIETFSRSSGSVATLVAGYNAGDTSNAGTFLTTQTVSTGVGDKYIGTSATSATMQTETA